MVIAMATVSLSPQQYQQMVDRIAGLESMMANLQSHAESQQEQIRVAELTLQQLRTTGTLTNPPPTTWSTSLKQGTEGGAFKALAKYMGNPSEYLDWSFSARRVLPRADERFAGLLQWISGTMDEIKVSDVLEYRRTTDLSTVDLDWLNSELYALLALKTTDWRWHPLCHWRKLKPQESLGGNDWNETRGYRNQRVSLLIE